MVEMTFPTDIIGRLKLYIESRAAEAEHGSEAVLVSRNLLVDALAEIEVLRFLCGCADVGVSFRDLTKDLPRAEKLIDDAERRVGAVEKRLDKLWLTLSSSSTSKKTAHEA